MTAVTGGEVAEDLFNRGLCLPSGTAMSDGDQNRVVSVIRRCGERQRRKKDPFTDSGLEPFLVGVAIL